MKLSIIIPMYNAASFIAKCLQSCLNQDIDASEYEMIVVDDGSDDGGAGIVRNIADESKVKIQLISRENAGQAAARNAALAQACGEYVWFVDADDWIQTNCLGTLLDKMSGMDALAFGMRNYSTDGDVVDEFRYAQDASMSGLEWIRSTDEKLKLCTCTYIWRRSLLEERALRFYPGIVHEDAEFIPRAIFFAERFQICTLVPYLRLIHPSSTTQTVNPKRTADLVVVLGRLKEFEDRYIPCDRAFNSLLSNLANYACRLSDLTGPSDRQQFSHMLATLGWLPKTLLRSNWMKYRIEGLLVSALPVGVPEAHRFLMKFKRK